MTLYILLPVIFKFFLNPQLLYLHNTLAFKWEIISEFLAIKAYNKYGDYIKRKRSISFFFYVKDNTEFKAILMVLKTHFILFFWIWWN